MVSLPNNKGEWAATKAYDSMSNRFQALSILFIIIIIIAGLLRFLSVADRPVHTDEAVNAFILADLLENGNYVYDRNEYHGPSLYYLSLPVAWIRSQTSLTTLDVTTLRAIPAIAGILLILLTLWLVRPLGWRFVVIASALLTVAPPLLYYSRYYIHEMLLVCFNLAFILGMYRYFLSKNLWWIVASGVFAGLMVATKETWIIIIFSQCVALPATVILWTYKGRKHQPKRWQSTIQKLQKTLRKEWRPLNMWHLAVFLLTACLVAMALFSSFMKNTTGISDAVKTYADYFHRAGQDTSHIHPWHYYFSLLIKNDCGRFPFRAEAWLLAAGIAGYVHVLLRNSMKNPSHPFFIFTAIYGIITAILFSSIPYKTPWNLLSFWLPLVIMAACFIEHLAGYFIRLRLFPWFVVFATTLFVHLTYQSWTDNFRHSHDPCNPFTYAHPRQEIILLTEEIMQLAETAPEGRDLHIEVIVPDNGYWPLPWYLRHFNSVGWYPGVEMDLPAAPLIIYDPALSSQLADKLFEIPPPGKRHLYIPLLDYDPEIRPGMPVSILVRKDYHDSYMARKAVQ